MIDSKKYKTMDIVGYLKSVLEDAKPYARMKLMIVGVQGIGKTSLLDQLRQEGSGSYKKKPVEVSIIQRIKYRNSLLFSTCFLLCPQFGNL